ncbi:MAG: molecular chaperone GrpE (heat shock protein) [Francisellaceae bacterium]|jgi:molecular chaperone GrpE (heat shock protein)
MNTENIITKFKNYIEDDNIVPVSDAREVDLYSFFKALTELKTETKRSSKQTQASLLNFKEAFSLMEEQFKSQEEIRTSLKRNHVAEIAKIEKEHIIELIDSFDRAERNIKESEHLLINIKQLWFGAKAYKKAEGLSNGMKLSAERIRQALNRKGVNRITTVGQIFDPKLMKLTEVVLYKEVKNFMVLEEVISGYTNQDGQVIRYAEVIANKHEGN